MGTVVDDARARDSRHHWRLIFAINTEGWGRQACHCLHAGCGGCRSINARGVVINADGLSTPANVSETSNLPVGGAVLRMNEPERPKNQSDTSDVRTDTQSIVNDSRRPENTTEMVRNSQNDTEEELVTLEVITDTSRTRKEAGSVRKV